MRKAGRRALYVSLLAIPICFALGALAVEEPWWFIPSELQPIPAELAAIWAEPLDEARAELVSVPLALLNDGIQFPDGGVQSIPMADGSTIRGSYAVIFWATASGNEGISAMSFGTTLAAPPQVHFVTGGATRPAECPGTDLAPEALPGHLCVYETSATNRELSCNITATGGTWTCDAADAYGAAVYVVSSDAGRTFSVGTWAVTAQEP